MEAFVDFKAKISASIVEFKHEAQGRSKKCVRMYAEIGFLLARGYSQQC